MVTAPGTAQTVSYDLNGNETSDGNHTCEWDAANRLTAITYPSSGNRSEFTYDGFGRRVKIVEKNSAGSVTGTKQFVFVGANMAEERDGSNAITKQYFPQGMAMVSGYSTTGNFYYTRDHLGSVRELLNNTGAITTRLDYDPYGNAATISGTLLPDFQYAGMYAHQPSGLSLTLFRAYDPRTARWLSRDPLPGAEMRQGSNLYEYTYNSPHGFVDLLGLCAIFTYANGTTASTVNAKGFMKLASLGAANGGITNVSIDGHANPAAQGLDFPEGSDGIVDLGSPLGPMLATYKMTKGGWVEDKMTPLKDIFKGQLAPAAFFELRGCQVGNDKGNGGSSLAKTLSKALGVSSTGSPGDVKEDYLFGGDFSIPDGTNFYSNGNFTGNFNF